MRASEERLRSIVETSPNGITVIDLKGNLTFMSKRSLEIFGTNMEDRLGRSLLDTIHPEDHFKVKEGIGAMIAGLEPPYRRFRGIYSNGSIFHIEATARYLENSLNEKKEILIVFNDITDKLLAEQELKRYVDLSKELENFAQVAAHDLQAPLRNIISFTKLLQKSVHSKLNQKEKEYFEFIVSATSGMNKLINSLLLYLKINASPTEFTAINPKSMLDLIIVESEAEIKSRNARINYPEKLPDTIYADKTKLKVLFQHLLCNALKFSKPDDNPVIHIRLEDQNHSWYFEIEDNGIGIKPEFQRKIFKIFQRLNSRQAYKGAGIGLALCKMIVEQHHGKIGLHSTFGKGSTFYFTINKESPVLN